MAAVRLGTIRLAAWGARHVGTRTGSQPYNRAAVYGPIFAAPAGGLKVGIPSVEKATDSVPNRPFPFLEKIGPMCTL